MYETVTVPFNNEYGDEKPLVRDPRQVIFYNASIKHLVITVVDPKTGVSAEAMIRKDALPDFVTEPEEKLPERG